MARNNTRGRRGWFGDSDGHAAAGRKGGRARGRKSKGNSNNSANE